MILLSITNRLFASKNNKYCKNISEALQVNLQVLQQHQALRVLQVLQQHQVLQQYQALPSSVSSSNFNPQDTSDATIRVFQPITTI